MEGAERVETVGMLRVRVLAARDLAAADMGSKSDPYVKIYWQRKFVGTTQTMHDVLDPVWPLETPTPVDDPNMGSVENASQVFFLPVSHTYWPGEVYDPQIRARHVLQTTEHELVCMVFDDDGKAVQRLIGGSTNGSFLGKVTLRGSELDPPANGHKLDLHLQAEPHRAGAKPQPRGTLSLQLSWAHQCGDLHPHPLAKEYFKLHPYLEHHPHVKHHHERHHHHVHRHHRGRVRYEEYRDGNNERFWYDSHNGVSTHENPHTHALRVMVNATAAVHHLHTVQSSGMEAVSAAKIKAALAALEPEDSNITQRKDFELPKGQPRRWLRVTVEGCEELRDADALGAMAQGLSDGIGKRTLECLVLGISAPSNSFPRYTTPMTPSITHDQASLEVVYRA